MLSKGVRFRFQPFGDTTTTIDLLGSCLPPVDSKLEDSSICFLLELGKLIKKCIKTNQSFTTTNKPVQDPIFNISKSQSLQISHIHLN